MRRTLLAIGIGTVSVLLGAGPALACGGLIGRNGSVNLVRTTTLAAWHDGVEHYVTAFKFAGAGGQFGSIIPLPGVPTSVEKGGDWTLQRLVREVTPVPPTPLGVAVSSANSGAAGGAEVLLETRIDALDITVLRGGAAEVGKWATDNGFLLTPDTPEVLDFYASRSPIFLAARFDADAAKAKGVALGDGTPVHITISTPNPWVPLRILGVGLHPLERINADVFLLTDRKPALLPGDGAPGLTLARQEPASTSLLTDLRSDKGMDWMPQSMWLSYLKVDALPATLDYDLAVDATGAGQPSAVAAGLQARTPVTVPAVATVSPKASGGLLLPAAAAGGAVLAIAVLGGAVTAVRRRPVETQ
ncbi:MAG TPA: DUF2330 domain-containing protein [Acidimicrobiales bacterium]|jgi:hypothetical protein|nr:DUF2330 domain-containing protein [Acidimicrobiales bacterium]